MHLKSNYGINTQAGTAFVELYIASVLVTTYSCDLETGIFTLSARPNDDELDLDTLLDNIAVIVEWMALVRPHIATSQTSFLYGIEQSRKATKFECKLTIEATVVLDVEYTYSTGVYLFKARPELTLTLNRTQMFIDHLSVCSGITTS